MLYSILHSYSIKKRKEKRTVDLRSSQVDPDSTNSSKRGQKGSKNIVKEKKEMN
jgi:hypothetical protein